MEALRNLITLPFQVRTIDFGNKQWHLGIPNKAGWYFIVTNAPVNVLEAIDSPLSEYTNSKPC
ncbi:MAG: hypothetical protein HW415_1623 [Deltaproteobacteria bacterium]|nr:hypothetical protein [Deltaproteobacteria bacterium]